ncbi:hypothetical protein Jab_2c27330 [Janthinobacterium sp. HH01]|uniref:DUF7024 domain-containing protein n=1 Tax=Janthinobacterium sp. HH01 TaxID=1198452 RepID=UPI0002AEC7F2|nr:hypothetical protein [Janthinobacterium sp. HH01]ELX10635.1 hypothetical protein Jab_2c27330 [Janthinobacterium sp. HH01]
MSPFRLAPRQRQALTAYGFPLALMAVLLYLVLRNTGANPVVFADEWLYSKFARLQPLDQSQVPSWLYLKLFGQTNACGTGFLQCARVLNAALFVAAAPFIYLVARPLAGRPAARGIALLAVLSPVSSYTGYFMPESMYFLGFWVLSWALLAGDGPAPQWRPTLRHALLGGALLGVLSLIKVHALFLLPALCLFLIHSRRSAGRRGWIAGGAAAAVLAALAAFAVKLALGYLLAGRVGLSLLGSFYGGQVSNSGLGIGRLLAPFAHNALGHAMGLLVLFVFPLAMLAAAGLSAPLRDALGRPGRALLAYTVLMLGAALGMTVLYTASIADAGPQEIIRLHLRYYDFTFPLLMIGAVAVVRHSGRLGTGLRAAIAAPLALLLLAATARLVPAFQLSAIDSPELFSMHVLPPLYYLLALLELALLALWTWRPQRAQPLYLLVLAPLFALAGEGASAALMHRAQQPNPYDQGGRLVHDFLDDGQRARLSIAGDSLGGLARAQFHSDHARTATIELQPGAPFDLTQTPARQQWLLVIGQHALPPALKPVLATPDYALVRLSHGGRSLYQVNMVQPLAGGHLSAVEGLADAEHWGSWSNARTVSLHSTEPLPRHLTVMLNGRAFGPNAGQDFVLRAGQASTRFKLPAATQELFLQLETDGQQHTLHIDVPQPVTPASLYGGNDTRLLGIGLVGVEIGEADADATPAPAQH